MAADFGLRKVLVAFRTRKYCAKMAEILPLSFHHSNMATAQQGMAFVTLFIANTERVLSDQQKKLTSKVETIKYINK